MNPSRGEVARFANELGCEKLRSQVLDLFEGLAPPPAAATLSGVTAPGAPAQSETAHLASPLAGPDIASPMAAAICKRDGERLVRLRSSPSLDEATQFETELGCEQLRPQLQRLMESSGFGRDGAACPRCAACPRGSTAREPFARSSLRKRALRAGPSAGGAFRGGG